MTERYAINTFAEALARIERDGQLYDVGQIAAPALRQLGLAAQMGIVVKTRDSWPIPGGGGAERTRFVLGDLPRRD